jgi:pimeloyl-ACP methyl ester carboxylesterase
MSETVVLLHGIWMPAWVMSLLARRLRRCGYRTAVFAYHSLQQALENNAEQLAGFIREQGDATVHLVGHSLGGLVILQALQKYPGLVAGRIVLLGSPVRGSVVARRLNRSRGLRWILGRSAHRCLLGDGPGWNGHLPLGVIAGTLPVGIGRIIGGLVGENDGIVTVDETHLENTSGSIQVHATHTGLLVSREVSDSVCGFLKDGHFNLL